MAAGRYPAPIRMLRCLVSLVVAVASAGRPSTPAQPWHRAILISTYYLPQVHHRL
jgi:hypothetical protein